MRVLIIEDEKLNADHLEELILKYDASIDLLGRIGSVKKGIEWFNTNQHPDLAFFDIQLGDGLSFEIFEKTEVLCPIIFTTAYNEYALNAFKVNSVDYLLKPIDFDELKIAIDKYKKNFAKEEIPIQRLVYDNILNMLTDNYKQRFVVKVGEHIKSIPVTNILYFYSLEKATFMHTTDNRNFVIDYSVEQLETLVDPNKFFRINRKFLISLESIQDIISYSNSRLRLELKYNNDMDAIVAREKVVKFKEWLDK
ncbi:MAG: LytTR family DNA-binding domain-containing protein [Bacteroidales bacterium]|nr:LytTR family DNA-binding domain-containing protein [Bacteroidales bacterium]MCF8405121.1 LytTR family DNA-binding domain-containing protein [Bacteroidales bacterium]